MTGSTVSKPEFMAQVRHASYDGRGWIVIQDWATLYRHIHMYVSIIYIYIHLLYIMNPICISLFIYIYKNSIYLFWFKKNILLLFNYSCLHLPPPLLLHPSQTHLSPLLPTPLGFVHVSFIVVPENPSSFPSHYAVPPSLWLLSDCS